MCYWCNTLFGRFQLFNRNTLSSCICGSCCTDLCVCIKTLLWFAKTNISLGYCALDFDHVFLFWWYRIFHLHRHSSVWTVWWISTGPSQLLQSCVLLFVCIRYDCSPLCYCWNWLSPTLLLVVEFAHWKIIALLSYMPYDFWFPKINWIMHSQWHNNMKAASNWST